MGVSFERNLRHFDWNGRLAPTNLASDAEIFAVAFRPCRGQYTSGADSLGPNKASDIDDKAMIPANVLLISGDLFR